jgi:hypothetical protein
LRAETVVSAFVINPLVRIHQKEKIALQIAAKIESVNGPK